MAVVNNNVIAIVVPAIAREGISKLVLSQVKALRGRDYTVVMVVLSDSSQNVLEDMKVHFSSSQLLVLKQKEAYLSVRNLFTSFQLIGPIIKFLKRHEISVVVAHAPYSHFVMRLVKLRLQLTNFNFKLVQYFHITQYAQFPLNSIRRTAINKINQILGQLYDADHIFVSEAVQEDIGLHLFRHPSSKVIYNALPTLNNQAQGLNCSKGIHIADGAYVIVIPGRIEQSKGQLFFMDVLKLFVEQRKLTPNNIQILVIGDGEQRQMLEKKVKAFNLVEYVNLLGSVPNTELLDWMNKADTVVLPSFFEGLPLVALEAMQTKAIVLTSDIKPFREIIAHGQNGFMFKAGNTDDCLEKLQFIYDNRSNHLIELEKAALQVAKKISFEHHMAQLVQVIN
ncbi:glycosyltransferase family 4 protein [Pontibacter arcticus]|uniref:Uncharacterized protein n=1 Tax=Pontibacter arcticus TaxID=2080288 RepID=A0A364RD15_9BACT|nr:glycosyltransferase family 4 protein [Pontibacter arcticus]RAU82221.1 hypothetical protein DP923_10520 [Pontibacter arcticus]